VPEKGGLLLVCFGNSAHIVIQIAVHRGHEIWVVTRSENHIRQARELGAAWAGCDFRDLPGKADGAVLFAPSGKLVPPTLEALDRGGICSIAGIHLSDVPSLDYSKHLYQERELLSGTANTREDVRAFLTEADDVHVQPRATTYALADANRSLLDMKHSNRRNRKDRQGRRHSLALGAVHEKTVRMLSGPGMNSSIIQFVCRPAVL
jgi:propanol-preferring alcohol dehydrogenase